MATYTVYQASSRTVPEVADRMEHSWTPDEMKAWLLKICAHPVVEKFSKMKISSAENVIWQDINLDDFDSPPPQEEQVVIRELHSYIKRYNGVRVGLYHYKREGVYREVFSKDSVDALGNYSDINAFREALWEMKVVKQSTEGYRDE